MEGFNREKLNRVMIEQHLKSAMTSVAPNVLDRIDLTQPQDPIPVVPTAKVTSLQLRIQRMATAVAACLCVILLYGGGMTVYRNGKVDSVIGIDVNPSVELSVNRKNKVLEAEALNEDAEEILDGMTLKGVDLNVAVNAVIGSMVQHGYLDDLDNAILVTVSNDSISKASDLRQTVVADIENTLEQNKVRATVYDQQAVANDELKDMARKYGISYGKAYFLQELIDQDENLTEDDMSRLASMNMEEIAMELSETEPVAEKETDPTTAAETETTTVEETTTIAETTASETTAVETTATPPSTAPETTAPTETEQESVSEASIKIDYVDYFNGTVSVNFVTKVKWKNPTVSIKDEDGNTYSALVGDTDSRYCEIKVSGLEAGRKYTFTLGGIYRSGKATTVSGRFEVDVVSEEATTPDETETEKETTEGETGAEVVETSPEETVPIETTEKAAPGRIPIAEY